MESTRRSSRRSVLATATSSAKKKQPSKKVGPALPTPENSPDVDIERARQDQVSLKARKKKEIQRINRIDTKRKATGDGRTPWHTILSIRPQGKKSDADFKEEVIAALESKVELVYPKDIDDSGAEDAYHRVREAADRFGVLNWEVDDASRWYEYESASDEPEETDDEASGDEDNIMQIDQYYIPGSEIPSQVQEAFQRATPVIRHIMKDSYASGSSSETTELASEAHKLLHQLNDSLKETGFEIPVNTLSPNYSLIAKQYRLLQESNADSAQERQKIGAQINLLKSVLDETIQRYRLPEEWTVFSADELITVAKTIDIATAFVSRAAKEMVDIKRKTADAESKLEAMTENAALRRNEVIKRLQSLKRKIRRSTASEENYTNEIETLKSTYNMLDAVKTMDYLESLKRTIDQDFSEMRNLIGNISHEPDGKGRPAIADDDNRSATTDQMDYMYPWYTQQVDKGWWILGYGKVGKGYRVVTARREDDGRIIHRIEPGPEVGRAIVADYVEHHGSLNLKNAQEGWSRKDEKGFVKVHWCTFSYIRKRNMAAGRTDPVSICFVEHRYREPGLLYATTLRKVLGEDRANREIIKVCRRDSIPCPWESAPIHSFCDPVALEKDPEKRRHLREQQAREKLRNRNRRAEDGDGPYESLFVSDEPGDDPGEKTLGGRRHPREQQAGGKQRNKNRRARGGDSLYESLFVSDEPSDDPSSALSDDPGERILGGRRHIREQQGKRRNKNRRTGGGDSPYESLFVSDEPGDDPSGTLSDDPGERILGGRRHLRERQAGGSRHLREQQAGGKRRNKNRRAGGGDSLYESLFVSDDPRDGDDPSGDDPQIEEMMNQMKSMQKALSTMMRRSRTRASGS
ncbi:Fc.00g081760.m01.CDS01 [Cosmosporella sp. VM-42]